MGRRLFQSPTAQEKAGDLDAAIRNFKRYIELAPEAPDTAQVRDNIISLEYQAEVAARNELMAANNKLLGGLWLAVRGNGERSTDHEVTVTGSKFVAVISALAYRLEGTIEGSHIRGQVIRPGYYADGVPCTVPPDSGSFTAEISPDNNSITGRHKNVDPIINFRRRTCTGKPNPETVEFRLERYGVIGIRFNNATRNLVDEVLEGEPAAKAGVQAGDTIVSVNGKKTNKKYRVELDGQAGTPVSVEIRRPGEKKSIKLSIIRRAQTSAEAVAEMEATPPAP